MHLRVVNQQGEALPGAVVSRIEEGGALRKLGATDAAGDFIVDFGGGADAMWRLHVEARGFGSVASSPFAAFWAGRMLLPLVLGRGFSLHGRVRDAAGKPVAGAKLCATDILPAPWAPWTGYVAAVSDDRGIFSLRGVPAHGMRLSLHADGYRSVAMSPVLAGTPLEFTLEPAPRLAGRVVDAEGKPVEAELEVHYEGRDEVQYARSGADGAFDLTWRHPCWCRVVARVGKPAEAFCASEVLQKPVDQLELRMRRVSELPMLRVRATGDEGKPLQDFRAMVAWGYGDQVPESYLRQQMMMEGHRSREGVAYLPGASNGSADGWLLLMAPGRAATATKVEWKPGTDGATELSIAMAPELRVTGIVKNASGDPVGGVRVWAQRVQKTDWDIPASAPGDAVRTRADGTFELGGLVAGQTDVFAARDYLPEGPARRVRLEAGGKAPAVRLKVGDLVTVAGRAVAVEAGWMLGFAPPPRRGGGSIVMDQPVRVAGPFAADGSFSISGVQAGMQTPTLLIPRPALRGDWLRIPVRQARVGRDGEDDFEVDAEITGPTRLRGRIVRRGTQVPFDRLLVQQRVERVANQLQQNFAIDWMEWMTSVRVGGDGSFELVVGPGRHSLRVIDMMTGIVLATAPDNVEADAESVAVPDLVLEAAEVLLEFVETAADEAGPAQFLVHRRGGGGNGVGFSADEYRVTGIDLRDRLTTRVVYVPAGEGEFHIQSALLPEKVEPLRKFSYPSMSSFYADGGGITFEAEAGEKTTVRVEVPRRTMR